MEEIPAKVKETIKVISKQRQIDEETLRKKLEEITNRPKIKDYSSDRKYQYASKFLWVQYMSKEPTKEFSMVIPFGLNDKRTTRSGNVRSTIYALVRGSSGGMVREIICRNKLVDTVNHIELFKMYKKIQLADRGFLEVAPTTRFDNPSTLNIDEIDFLTKYCKLPKLSQLRDMPYHISKLNEAGFVQNEDIKIVSGMTVRYNKGQRKDGSKFAVYNIKDESLGLEDKVMTVGNKKVVLPSTVTVWVPPQLAIYDAESELAFTGPIQIGRTDKKLFMNAYTVIPEGIVREISEK